MRFQGNFWESRPFWTPFTTARACDLAHASALSLALRYVICSISVRHEFLASQKENLPCSGSFPRPSLLWRSSPQLAFPASPPSILAESMRMLIEHKVQSRSQIEGALGLNLSDVESLCGVPKGFLDARVVQLRLRHPTDQYDA